MNTRLIPITCRLREYDQAIARFTELEKTVWVNPAEVSHLHSSGENTELHLTEGTILLALDRAMNIVLKLEGKAAFREG